MSADSEALLTAHAASQACLSCEDLRRRLASEHEANVQALMALQGQLAAAEAALAKAVAHE